MILRPYQVDAVRGIYGSLRQNDRTMLQLPTGSGKSCIASDIIKHGLKHNRRINFCVDRLTLLDQTVDRFIEDGIDVGVIQGNHPLKRPHAPVQIVSLQTLKRRPKEYWPQADLFIVDEAHDQHQIIYDIMERWNSRKYIGLSATPFTRGLGNHWQDLVVGATTRQLIEAGYLSRYRAFGPSSPNLVGVRQSGGDYSANDAAERMNVLTGGIVSHWKKHAEGLKTIGFTPNVAYAEHLAEQFRLHGVEADFVCGRDTEERRRDVMGRFSDGRIQVLMNCEVLTKGYDQPDIMCGIIAKPTRSLSTHIQMLGRLLRTHPDKDHALILDHAGNIERLGFPDDDLPTELDIREKGVNSDTRQKDDPLPWNCPKCHSLVPRGTRICACCGFRAAAKTDIEVVEENLQEMTRNGSKQEIYSMLNCVAQSKGFSTGWISHKYRALTGVWPKGLNRSQILTPSPKLQAWLAEEHRKFTAHNAIKRKYAK